MAEEKDRDPGQSQAAYTAHDIARAARRLDGAFSQLHGEFSGRMGMTTPELLALSHISMSGPDGLGPSELARRLHMTTGAATTLLDRLEARGHIVRERHATDRRKVLAHVTPEARDEVLKHVRPLTAEITALADGLTDDQRRTVGEFLDAAAAIVARHAAGGARRHRGRE